MDNSSFKPVKFQISIEKSDLIHALENQRFFSHLYGAEIQIRGYAVRANGFSIDQINSDDQVDLLWSEYLFEIELRKSRSAAQFSYFGGSSD